MSLCYKPSGLSPPSTASCYICLEHSTDRKPLLRNCACRGDAGWAHVACLVEFAASKVTEAQRDPSINILPFWNTCILCKTPHMQYMGLAMAEAFVKQYEHLPETHKLRSFSLYSLASSKFDVGDHDDAFGLFVRLHQLLDVLTSTGVDVRKVRAHVYCMTAGVFLKKGKRNDALTAFERHKELCVDIHGPNSPKTQYNHEIMDRLQKTIGLGDCGHMDPAAELVMARQRFNESQERDKRSRLCIHARLVEALQNDGKIQESMEQFEKLLADSRQCLGPDHPETLGYMNRFLTPLASNSLAAGTATAQKKGVWAVIDCEQQPAISGQRVKVLEVTKDFQKYICLIKNDKGVSSKFKVTPNQFILETGTMVVVHGLVSSKDLNGRHGIISSFDKKKRRYVVNVEKKKTAVLIKPINLSVIFISGAYCHL